MPRPIVESSDLYQGNCFIHTQGGRWRLDSPTFDVHSMAHALGQLARYNGHADQFYSVAEHSVLVSLLMQELSLGNPLEGLLHDGCEAWLSDIPAPFKHRLPDWQAVEAKLDGELRHWFGLPAVKTAGCKQADWLALFIEASQIVPGRGEDFEDPQGFRKQAGKLRNQGWHVACHDWKTAKAIFLLRYEELTSGARRVYSEAAANAR